MHHDTASHRWSVAPAQRALDHETLGAAIRAGFAEVADRLRAEAADLAVRMADVGSIQVVERDGGVQILYRPHHGEGPHRLVGDFDLHLTHDGQAAIHMRIRDVAPPAEVLDFEQATAERLRARLALFETQCRHVPAADGDGSRQISFLAI